MWLGSVDKVDVNGADGWLVTNLEEAPKVRAWLGGSLVGEAIANSYREDLKIAGLGNGYNGFEIQFFETIERHKLVLILFKAENSDLLIPFTNSLTSLDLVGHLLGNYPTPGRTRSLLGGLWTDRMDAPQLLSSKLNIGLTDATAKTLLRSLINDGFVVLSGLIAPSGLSKDQIGDAQQLSPAFRYGQGASVPVKAALSSLASLLFRDPLPQFLKAVFEDSPVLYPIDKPKGEEGWLQACVLEASPSPTESLVIYAGSNHGYVRLEYIRNSHELAEFTPSGLSRWTPDGREELGTIAVSAGLSVEAIELNAADLLVVGPGLIHRVSTIGEMPSLSIFCVPRRVTPARMLLGIDSITEVRHVSGAMIRA